MSAPDARRLEELSLNSSSPPGQLVYDGWLVRLAPGKAKRARSVNAVYPSSLPLDEKIGYCERLYASCDLPAIFRLTPFSQPPALDRELESRGYHRFDVTAVESAPIAAPGAADPGIEPMALDDWVGAVARLRGSPEAHRRGHVARLEAMPLAKRAVAMRCAGSVVATGLAIIEDDCAGLFDIVTHEQERRRGHARRIVQALLAAAWELGARHAYLQVQQDNGNARKLYTQFGFEEKFLYWYRGREAQT
ncbi:MAG TPA: GNAT family N-acetyltransferase [Usitatibacter sp.]|jgi:GNAT superfamily N-acetyltransferase|nr:GNAT family N-acetyltransferase [Usitatibacter sp.]